MSSEETDTDYSDRTCSCGFFQLLPPEIWYEYSFRLSPDRESLCFEG